MNNETGADRIDISLVIPVYNAALFIYDTLKSLAGVATVLKAEFILINDGSTDHTSAEIDRFMQNHPELDVRLSNRKKKGVSISRNEGLAMATGEYISFVDADDLVPHTSLQKKVDFLQKSREFAGVTSMALSFQDNPEVILESLEGLRNLEKLLYAAPGYNSCPSGYVWCRSILMDIYMGFDPELQSSADKFFLLQIMQKARIGFIPDAPFYYRKHAASMSTRITENLVQDKIAFTQKVQSLSLKTYRKTEFLTRNYYAIAGMYGRLGNKKSAFIYLLKSIRTSPIMVIQIRRNRHVV